ncbi:serine/arginine-rich splicing factor SR45-like isoform X2 [Papaver somniferum]|uniref:serine/arginine-rich splicing factor SR45-like isoform X2 n=1 Tax=Papaver somniferum TaxID=3469 RepID=UPI000E6FFD4D|nr:serine/arginine-rich splicing factor SR45-like isoform X2 [Papaver somniferum]
MPFSLKHNLNFLIPFLQMLVNVLKLYKRFRSRRKMWRRLLIGRGLPFKPARVLLQVNLPRGFGYVVYMTRAYAEKALLFMDGAQIDGNVVRARFTLSPRKKGSSPTKIVPASQKKDGVDIQKDAPHRQRDYRFGKAGRFVTKGLAI